MNKIVNILLGLFCLTALALAADAKLMPFQEADFAHGIADGNDIVLMFHADWCPTCKKQHKELTALDKEGKLQQTVYIVDYDNSDELQKKYRVNRQSTLIRFKNNREVSRKVGVTSREDIMAFLE